MNKVKALLIAAGNSRRMGSPKQLLPWGESTLIEHQIATLQKSNLDVSVVLGANFELIASKIGSKTIEIVKFENWQKGMGASISFGVKRINQEENSTSAILICLVDQPLLEPSHFNEMMNVFETGKKQIIVSQSHSGYWSAPVLFDPVYISELLQLDGEEGAKKVIQKHQRHVKVVTCGTSLEDMDTPEAYETLLKQANRQS